jgi:glycosyltransferase involved in cell wall biosynthesis
VKIVLVHNHYQQPGGEDVVFGQERELLERYGHQTVLFRRDNADTSAYGGIKRLVLIQKAIWNDEVRQEFVALLRAEQPDIVHVHNTWMLISPSIYSACREEGVPVVQTLHNYRLVCPGGTLFRDGAVCEECLDQSLWRGVRHGCYRDSKLATASVALLLAVHRRRGTWSDDITSYIVPSQFARSRFLMGGLPAEKLFVKPNFVDPDPLPAGAGSRLRPEGSYALFAGRLAPKKRVTTLLDAWTRLPQRIPLVIVGGGPEREELERETADKKLDMVSFRGQLSHDDTLAAMREARFLIFSSEWYETFGLTMVEAFACGVPVICSRVGAMQEIVDDGRTGLHFNPGDSEDLAAKIEWALTHPDRMRQMGREARREYESKYTADRNYPLLMEIYQRAIAGSNSPLPGVESEIGEEQAQVTGC